MSASWSRFPSRPGFGRCTVGAPPAGAARLTPPLPFPAWSRFRLRLGLRRSPFRTIRSAGRSPLALATASFAADRTVRATSSRPPRPPSSLLRPRPLGHAGGLGRRPAAASPGTARTRAPPAGAPAPRGPLAERPGSFPLGSAARCALHRPLRWPAPNAPRAPGAGARFPGRPAVGLRAGTARSASRAVVRLRGGTACSPGGVVRLAAGAAGSPGRATVAFRTPAFGAGAPGRRRGAAPRRPAGGALGPLLRISGFRPTVLHSALLAVGQSTPYRNKCRTEPRRARAPPKRGSCRLIPAATYSPRGSPPKYHRRWRA